MYACAGVIQREGNITACFDFSLRQVSSHLRLFSFFVFFLLKTFGGRHYFLVQTSAAFVSVSKAKSRRGDVSERCFFFKGRGQSMEGGFFLTYLNHESTYVPKLLRLILGI